MINKKIKDVNNHKLSVNILTHYPERLLNYLWTNDIKIKNFKRLSFVEIYFEIDKDKFPFIEEFCKSTNSKIEKVRTISWHKIFSFIKNRAAVLLIAIFCIGVFLYFENFIWKMDIETGNIVSPLEIRKILYENGIIEGMPKSEFNFQKVEKLLMDKDENILWCKARVVGGILNINIEEKITPPIIEEKPVKYEIKAIKDGVIDRFYSIKGVVTVSKGDTVKKGDVLIQTTGNGASGDVFAKVFYESEAAYPLKKKVKVYSGNSMLNISINLFNNEFKIKNNTIKYIKYDKIDTNIGFLKFTKYVEYREEIVSVDEDKIMEYAKKELTYKIIRNCDRAIEVKDTIIDKKQINDTLVVKLLLIGIENIAEK
ncbi:MAG: sporulation protein YqfD [Oscillospiraceae bacterium]|nr:sporulation protein YqfD [Oscillospiraceae bacterium]